MPKICIDPGHNSSGADTGVEGSGLYEQSLTLDIASRLKSLLVYNGFEVVMTREGDFVNGAHGTVNESLKTRCDIANAFGADLFVSIHINSGGGTGTEVYALPGGRAVVAAQRVLNRLIYACGWTNRGVKIDREFYVLVHTDMPAILTENGFIDTQSDAAKLADPNFRQVIAVAHAKGICDYFGILYKEMLQGGTTEVKNIVIYADGDVGTALLLSYKLQCPMILEEFANSVSAENKHWVGVQGTNGNGNFYYAGSDRFATAQSAL